MKPVFILTKKKEEALHEGVFVWDSNILKVSWNCGLKSCHNILLSLYLALYPGWATHSYEGLDLAGFSFLPGSEGWLPGRKKNPAGS